MAAAPRATFVPVEERSEVPTAHTGYCAPPLPPRAPGWETRRDGHALRRLVKRRALELDWRLAGGAAIGQSDELRLRAEQLLLPEGREALARSIDRLVSWTDHESDSRFRVRDG